MPGFDTDPRQPAARFDLGQTVMTSGVSRLVEAGQCNPASLLDRHHAGDWGDLDADDKRENERSIAEGARILSRYNLECGESVYVITEHDRSVTTVLLVQEY